MNKIILFCLTIIVVSCGICKHKKQNPDQTNPSTMITASIGETDQTSDNFSITDVRVKGNTLSIDVNYSGGCEEHQFEMVGSKNIAKSLPPIRSIQLVHKANGDKCKKLVMQTIEVDIKALAHKQESGDKIFLTLDGWKDRIEYTFE